MGEFIGVLPIGLASAMITAQGLLLALVILAIRTEQRLINGFLAMYLIAESLRLGGYFFHFIDMTVPVVLYLIPGVSVLAGPAIFLYVTALTQPGFRWSYKFLWHLVPAIIGCVALLKALQLSSSNVTLSDAGIFEGAAARFPFVTLPINLILVAYVAAALIKLRGHRSRLESVYSSVESVSLAWLRLALLLLLISWCTYILIDILKLAYHGHWLIMIRYEVNILVSALIFYLMAIGGMRQPIIFSHSLEQVLLFIEKNGTDTRSNLIRTVSDADVLSVTKSSQLIDVTSAEVLGGIGEQDKYSKSGLNPDRVNSIWEDLIEEMRVMKPYLEHNITLTDLAQTLEISPQVLSQVINSRSRQTFYQFINGYRIEAAKLLLAMEVNKGKRILDIAEEVGFNSHSTFYSHFKKREGITPVQYRKEKP